MTDDLEKDELVTNKWRYGVKGGGFWNAVALTIVVAPVMIMIGVFMLGVLDDVSGLDGTDGTDCGLDFG